ncbi:hypothetical protein G4B88_009746 [Cannabis sativa]|uniref:RNase H type-1 domain-containing protein n=1 Tax=Cannabis sativa TaxID=3483 RepID=A0A7J6DM17_CANSA|nr:hypothetical protein G4B88_009746 [Cannabis sativa]
MNQFLRMDTPASHTVTSTTPLTSAPMAFPQQPSSSTIPPPIITTSIITHTKKGKGIALTTSTTPHPLATELRVWSLMSLALNLLLLLLLEPGGTSLARLLRTPITLPSLLFSKDYKDAQILSSTLSLPQPSSPHALHHILQEDTPALFVDAALNHEDDATGLGLVFRKGPHQILNSATFCKAGASTPIFGEAQSLYEGIQWCISSQLIPRFIFTDCLNLVTKVNGTWHDHSTLSSLIFKKNLDSKSKKDGNRKRLIM